MSYLRGSPDRDPAGISYDAGAPSATWQTRAYTVDELSAIFAKDARTNVGTLTGLDLRNRGVSGRLISVTLIGTAGSRTVSGTVFAAAFNAGKASTDAAIRGTLMDVVPIP
jgi:peptidoglycan hydrolase-like amidase